VVTAGFSKMNTGGSKKAFHRVNDIAIMALKALLRAISGLHLLDAEPIRCGRIFVRQDDPALVGGSSGRPNVQLAQHQPTRNMEPQS
jgi:hypothetical protein